jgi:WhiB family transcriptional regulator, redox-sensing transcriptional regulator
MSQHQPASHNRETSQTSTRHRDQGDQKEVKDMTMTVLDPIPGQPTLGDLHDEASKVDETSLPCRSNDPELWFAESPSDVEYAKALCTDCPVLSLCLVGALERREPWGVWGGQLLIQGVVVPRKRPRGRPRKSEVAA